MSQIIGKAIDAGFNPTKVGLMIAGMEVPNAHLHVPNASAESLDEAAERIRAALSDLGYEAAT